MKEKDFLPHLPYDPWENTKMTLHLILQIIGKVRLKMTPRKNHWWYITEYVSSQGFTTSSIPCHNGYQTFDITLNVHKKKLEINTSWGEERSIELKDGLTISEFYHSFVNVLRDLNIHPKIIDKPFDLGIEKRFSEITEYHHFDFDSIRRFWKIMLWVSGVFKEFGGRFYGKTCPVHLYWHHMDLAITRFSGKKAPPMDRSARLSDKDAYSHEVISFGFWAGDPVVREPAFYSYTYPSPQGLDQQALKPSKANWVDNNGSPMALYRYKDLLNEENPREALLDFLESSYLAGARLANWDIEELEVIDLKEL